MFCPVVRYSLEGAEFALRISGTAAKNFFIFAQAVLHDSKKIHGKTHLIRLLKEQKPLKFFTVDKDRIEVSDLAYSYNKFYAQNMPDKVAWETLQSDLFANLPQIKAERMPQDFSIVLPKLWRKRQAWNAERTKRPPYRGEER